MMNHLNPTLAAKQLTPQLVEPSSEALPNLFDSIPFITGEAAINQSGLVPRHVLAMQTIAENANVILMFRPVNRLATGLLEAGAVAKGMHIKAKTSDWGPMAGLIPSDQRLSKNWRKWLNESPPPPLTDHKTSEQSTSYYSMPLILKPKRLKFLSETEKLIELPEGWETNNQDQPIPINIPGGQSSDNPGAYFSFRMCRGRDGAYRVEYRAHTDSQPTQAQWQSLNVLKAYTGSWPPTPEKLSKPTSVYKYQFITADYDAFAYLPHASSNLVDRYEHTKLPEPLPPDFKATSAQSPGARLRKVVSHIQANHLGQTDRRHITENIGREPAWQRTLRGMLNSAIGAPATQLIQHATEMDNLYVPEKDQHILIITPWQRCYLTQNWDQVQATMHIANKQHYIGYSNRTYNAPAGSRLVYPGMTKEQLKSNGPTIEFDPLQAFKRLTHGSPAAVSEAHTDDQARHPIPNPTPGE